MPSLHSTGFGDYDNDDEEGSVHDSDDGAIDLNRILTSFAEREDRQAQASLDDLMSNDSSWSSEDDIDADNIETEEENEENRNDDEIESGEDPEVQIPLLQNYSDLDEQETVVEQTGNVGDRDAQAGDVGDRYAQAVEDRWNDLEDLLLGL